MQSSPTGVDASALARWLGERIPGCEGPLALEKLAGGASNLTFRVRDAAGHAWVLRRPPAGALLATAHDMGREVRVQRALAGSAVPVPPIHAVCEDASVLGAPFYVMGWIDGVVYATRADAEPLSDAQARAASFALVDAAAALHAIDPAAVGLERHGRPEGFMARQIRRFREQWQRSRRRELPLLDEVGERLGRELPPEARPAIVHGDFGFNNALFSRDEPERLAALLDWEMSTLGDPLSDVGMLLAYWGPVGELLWRDRGGQAHRAKAGFPKAEELVDRYVAASGRDPAPLGFHEAFATYKLAVICEGAYARMRAGSYTGQAEGGRDLVPILAEAALAALERRS